LFNLFASHPFEALERIATQLSEVIRGSQFLRPRITLPRPLETSKTLRLDLTDERRAMLLKKLPSFVADTKRRGEVN
jgi:hypothetical protein